MDTQLLCLFTTKPEFDAAYAFIVNNYIFTNSNIFVLENKFNEQDLYITFNVERGSSAIESKWKTILVHRKKQSNTIYTINALNEVIKSKTGGQIDPHYMLEWDLFKNCILVTTAMGYKKIPTRIFKTFLV
jgi:hypothetical protein